MAFIVDYKISKTEYDRLSKFGKVIPSDKVNVLPPIDGHPDLQIHVLNDKVFLHRDASKRLVKAIAENTNKEIIVTNSRLRPHYPLDIPFNSVSTPKVFIHNTEYTNQLILEEVKNTRKSILNVKQGYSGCSTLVISDTAFITSDMGIHRVLSNNNLESLLVSKSFISLPGMDSGFIGGTSKLILHRNTYNLLTFGDITKHPDFNLINQFIKRKVLEYTIVNLSTHQDDINQLLDRGSIIEI